MKLTDYVAHWMETYKKNSVKGGTYERLEGQRTLLNEYGLAQMGIDGIQAADVQRYVNELVADGYALTTIKKQLHIVRAPLRFAHSQGILPRDPTYGVQLPTQTAVKRQKRDVEAYAPDEQERLRKAIADYSDHGNASTLLMLESGMRVGECLALNWSDIDWRKKAVRIHATIAKPASKRKSYVQEGAKTHTSNRTIPLSDAALTVLQAMKQVSPTPWVFSGSDGERLSYAALRYRIKKVSEAANVPYKGMHVFRHTFATDCYHRGCDVKILSKLLGHASTAITYNTYIHLFGDALEEMRNVLGRSA
ncbi:MAG: site-specific integrase [Christensenellaceae bacterium]|nr:site-specific integrase [Christensenellaceae bacterium]